ncbi:MAG TPA: glycosyltransferase family 9 protein [Nitrospira sp.]|nr:glycosyltransferase family 9 protein [Nitrospira sp.]
MERTVVIIHPGAVGDVLLAVPAMRGIRARFPRHELLLCAHEQVARLLQKCRVIDAWMSVGSSDCAELFGRSAEVPGVLKDWLGRCDLAVAWMQDESGTVAAVLQRGGAKDVRVRSPFSSQLFARHQSDRFAEAIGEPATASSPPIALAVPDHLLMRGLACLEERGVRADQPIILVHPGSGSRHKCVGPEVLLPVMKQLQDEGAFPVVLEGPADHESVRNLLTAFSKKPPVLRGLDLCTLAGLLAHMQLFIGHDSGMTHLSSLVGLRTVALFGPTDPVRWAPRGRLVTVARGTACTCRSWDAVIQCIEKPCLALSVEKIVSACRIQHPEGANPRNPSRSSLSQPTPYAKVAS